MDSAGRGTQGLEIDVEAPSLPMLFDESGMALAQLASGEDAGAPASTWERVELEAPDLQALASTWFNELMGDAIRHHAEVVDVAVDSVSSPPEGPGSAWRLRGRVGLRWLFGHRGPARRDLHATAESLSVEAADGTWRLRAHLDAAGASG